MIGFAALLMAAATTPDYCEDPQNYAQEESCALLAFERMEANLTLQWQRTADAMKQRDRDYQQDEEDGWFTVLLAAQRAWIDYRETHCASAAHRLDPHPKSIQIIMCRNSMAEIRTQQLRDLEEGIG